MTKNSTPFDNLFLRRFSQLGTEKDAFHVLLLVKIYIHKLKFLIRCSPEEKQKIKKKLRANHKVFQSYSPWKKQCKLRCGLLKDVSCGQTHRIYTGMMFEKNENRFWPNFCEKQVPILDIGKVLDEEIEKLSFSPDERGQFCLRQHCELVLTSFVDKANWVAMTTPHLIQVGDKLTTIRAGRSQAICVGGVHSDVGTAAFKSASASVLALSVLQLHHVQCGHNKLKTRLSLLKSGWIFSNIQQTLKSLENNCPQCRVNKAKKNNTTTNIHVNTSGRSYNLGMLASHPDGHTMSVDQLGPIFGKNDEKFWAYIFYSHNCAMVFSMITNELSAVNVHLCVNILTSFIGKVTLLISDQQPAFQPFATNFEMENTNEEWGEIPHRQLRNPLARLLKNAPKEGKSDLISWKIVGGHSGEFAGEIEKFIHFFKGIMADVDFHQKAKHYDYLQMSSAFSTMSKAVNSRPILKTDTGQVYSPFDLMGHSLVGGGPPDTELRVPTDSERLMKNLSSLASLKRDIQESIFLHFSQLLVQNKDFRQRGNFAFHSQGLRVGDIVLLNRAYALTKNLSGSLRRIAFLDRHKRHGIVYHLISPKRKFNLEDFQIEFDKCKNKSERQICVQHFLGRFSFESTDLRHCSFVAEAESTGNIDIFSAKNPNPRPPQIHTEGSLNVGQLHNKLMSEEGTISASLPSLPTDLLQQARKYKFQNNKKWSTQQLWDDNDDHGEENNRFQDRTEDQGSGSNNEDDHDDDKGQVVEEASGVKEIRTRRGRVVRKPDRFRP